MSQLDAANPAPQEAEPRTQLALDILVNPTDTGVDALPPANKSLPPPEEPQGPAPTPDVQSIYEAHTLHRAEAIAARTKQRAERKALLRIQASSHKVTADALVDQNKLKAALTHYHEAIRLWYSNPEYHIALAACFRKLGWFEEAAHSCTTALTLQPTSSAARYLRGVSRLSQRMLLPAKTDFQTVLEHEPTHILARAALSQLELLLASDPSLQQPEAVLTMDYRFPDLDYELLEVASVSDSDESNHVGNGVPCRFYNQLGCVKGTNCEYSHAPDERSVRDLLGRNVCTYHLLSSCKFGLAKCVYSHHKDALPAEGWWTSPTRIAKIKATLESVEQKKRDLRVLEQERIRLQYRAVKESHQKEKEEKKAGHHHFPKTPKTAVSFAPDAGQQQQPKKGQGKHNGKPPHSATIKKATPAPTTPAPAPAPTAEPVVPDTAPKAA